jgi:hypothetical protein
LIDKFLDDTHPVPLVTRDEDDLLTAADELPTAAVYEDGGDDPMAYAPTVSETNLTGRYIVPLTLSAANGFAEGSTYEVWGIAVLDGDTHRGLLCEIAIKADQLTTIEQQTASASITPLSPLDATDGGALDVLDRDDYSSETGQPVTFEAEGYGTPDAIWFDVSYKRVSLLHLE